MLSIFHDSYCQIYTYFMHPIHIKQSIFILHFNIMNSFPLIVSFLWRILIQASENIKDQLSMNLQFSDRCLKSILFNSHLYIQRRMYQSNNNSAANIYNIQPTDKPIQTQSSVPSKKIQTQSKPSSSEPEQPRQVWFCQLFRFATTFDYVLMVVGSIAAIAMGTALPAFSYIWGSMTDSFTTADSMVEKSKETMLTFIYVGIGAFFAGWLMFACWMITGERQAISCRKAYLRSLLRQQIGWFDVINQTQLASKFATDTFAFQGALGQKISTMIMTIATLIAGFIFAFITGWLMTLVVLATIPALGIAGYFYIKIIGDKDKKQQKSYSNAGGRAEQAIAAIKTVKQLNGQAYECVQYEKCLQKASQNSFKYSVYSGLGIASIFFVMLASYSLGFWYGSKCILGTQNCPKDVSRQTYTAGDVLVVFFSVVMGGFNISQLTPAFKKISEGRQAAARIFAVIDREPVIQNPPNGIKIQNLKGQIRFENVTFTYPKDRSRKVFQNLTMDFHINKTGLVGESGCGKSTTLQLIMRFYDPDQGRITLDGHDLRTLDLMWLRQQIGYVGQQPVLFATSIKENLLFGNEKATQQDIKQALKMAEAYDFVQSLEQKLETYVGYGGGQLSGGQKQRIAIARAILRKPKIMLLDEATSALDRRNERLIQDTLEKVTQGMTTITVAHRVKTIMNSDMIYVFSKGGIAQKGKFNELSMFKNYQQQKEKEVVEEVKDEDEELKKLMLKKKQSGRKQSLKQQQQELFMTKQQKEKQKQKKIQKQLVDKYDKAIFSRIFSYSKEKLPVFILGIICALAAGVIFPIFSIFLSKMLAALLTISYDPTNQTAVDNINLYALIFLILAICSLVITTIQITCLGVVGQHITRKIRIQTFFKILKMPVPWYDIPRNNAGTLTARLSTDCQLVNTVTTTTVSIMIQNISTLIAGVIIAFVHEWRTALVALGLLPLMIISGAIQMAFSTGFSDKTDAAYKDSSNLIMEAMVNIRTVSSFGYEGIVAKRYDEKMEEPYRLAVKKGNASGFFFGLSQLVMFTIFGILFYLGALFVRDNPGQVTVQKMFTAIYAIMFAGMTAGNNAHFMPDAAACKNSAANLFEILDSQDQDQMQIAENSKLLRSGAEGDIVLDDVDFKYESRNQYVFKHMSLKVKRGNKVAFVGTSGCGKSTIIQLLQRFYFPQRGTILINGIDIKDFDIHYLRSRFGVVSQEPVLFNGSFAQNIKYNKDDATMDQIQSAAKQANAMSFILGDQQTNHEGQNNGKTGFDRNVGVKGSHISGGQKQRVAIARTILRNPETLLLDEATSALDRTNEKKVQQSLDNMMHGKTVISIAHRIETIKNSDEIYMFEKGKIVESGSYNELVAKQGYFYNLERGTSFT